MFIFFKETKKSIRNLPGMKFQVGLLVLFIIGESQKVSCWLNDLIRSFYVSGIFSAVCDAGSDSVTSSIEDFSNSLPFSNFNSILTFRRRPRPPFHFG